MKNTFKVSIRKVSDGNILDVTAPVFGYFNIGYRLSTRELFIHFAGRYRLNFKALTANDRAQNKRIRKTRESEPYFSRINYAVALYRYGRLAWGIGE